MSLGVLFVFAYMFYSAAIVGHWLQPKRKFSALTIISMVLGFALDSVATYLVCARYSRWVWNLHSVTGTLALVIMGLHLAWMLLARKNARAKALFDKWSIWAWILWMVAFFSGGILGH